VPLLRADKSNNLDLCDLFDAATFRAAAANLVYVELRLFYKSELDTEWVQTVYEANDITETP